MTDTCVFCRIVAGDAPADVVAGDGDAIAFFPTGPAARGHTLVVPRTHAVDIWDIAERDLMAVMAMAKRVAHLLDDRLRPDGMNLTQANRVAAGQDVFHFHLHVIPRWSDDGYRSPWRSTDPSAQEIAQLLAELGAPREPSPSDDLASPPPFS